MTTRCLGIAAVLFLPLLVAAERVKEDNGSPATQTEPAVDLQQYISDQEIICGGPAIWSTLTATHAVNSVQNINWGKMEAEKVAYIDAQKSNVELLKMEIASLATLIEERMMEELPEYTTEERHAELIEAAVGADSFGGLEIAQSSDCGNPRSRPRAPRRAFQLSLEVFDTVAKQFFKGKQWRLDPDGFLDTCHSLLPDQGNSYCGPLCQRYKDTAQQISAEAVGETAGNSDELVKQHKLKQEELARTQAEISECDKAWGGLLVFKGSMEELLKALEQRDEALRDAEQALDDAQWELMDAEEELEQEKEALEEAADALESAGQKAAEAKVTLDGTISKEKQLKGQLDEVKSSLGDARKRVERMRGADRTVADLKSAVSATMLKMNLFSSAAVVQPLRDIGFTQSLDIDKVFPADLKNLPAASALQGSVESLHEYCAITAKPSFDAVKDQVDLNPLCQLDQMEDIVDDLIESVADRTESVKEQLLWLKSWLNPYRGGTKDMTPERAEELVRLGEPEGLQETIGAYHRIGFFKSYLVHWRYNGKFQELLAQLKGLLSSLEAAIKSMEDERESIKGQIADLKAAREDAAKALERANLEALDKQEQKAKVVKAIAQLKEQGEGLALRLEELEKAVAEAQRLYEEALKRLDTHFDETTKPFKAGNATLLQLQEQDDEAEKLINVLERLLAKSEKKLQVSELRLAEIKPV